MNSMFIEFLIEMDSVAVNCDLFLTVCPAPLWREDSSSAGFFLIIGEFEKSWDLEGEGGGGGGGSTSRP